ncbi:Protein NEN1 [Abeliophyllum distichum]|uniref:Protein NEN1 n=1 Tax=Abeliophyllum distichum TaxID=126358 RepID=A0ABD1RX30_9LAMI
MVKDPIPEDNMEEENSLSSQESSTASASGVSYGCTDFLEADNISIPSLSVTFVPFYRGSKKMQVLHKNYPLQVSCRRLKVLDASDNLAQKLSVDSGSCSEWRNVVTRKPGFYNYPTVRLHLPTVADGDDVRCITEIYQKDSSATQRLVFSRFDIVELESLFTPGNLVDAYFSVDAYDYQQNAGIRAVAKKLIFLTN